MHCLFGLGFSPVYLTYNHEKRFIKSPAQLVSVWLTRGYMSLLFYL